ncbi:MAG: 16S rRNA processing protein RimM [Rhodospirillales bacterium]|nr:16S rRNA processing protein RimM [Rhodospirillales bacterium]
MATTTDERRVCLGVVTGAKGLKGDVRVHAFTADPAAVVVYGPLSDDKGRSLGVPRLAERRGQDIVLRFDGVTDRDQAMALKGRKLFVPRSALPATGEEEFYHKDLIGLAAETQAGERLGIVKAVHNFGAGDLVEIEPSVDVLRKGGAGRSILLPFTQQAVPVVDIAGGRIVVDPPAEEEAPPPAEARKTGSRSG